MVFEQGCEKALFMNINYSKAICFSCVLAVRSLEHPKRIIKKSLLVTVIALSFVAMAKRGHTYIERNIKNQFKSP